MGKYVFLLVILLSNCSKYIMSTGDTRRSQSATIFDTARKEKDNTNHGNKPPSKRLRKEDNKPAILVKDQPPH